MIMEIQKYRIRCLTSFITKFSFLEKCKLQCTELVIDGDSISQQLYLIHTVNSTNNQNDCLEGDYDVFEDYVDSFFEMLINCQIIPYVVFEGGVRSKQSKLNKVSDRLQHVKDITNNLSNQNGMVYYPLFVRDVVENTLKKWKIETVRCDFESYPTVVSIAKTLDCPVLSYDPDYFICSEITYIPFQTFCHSEDKLYPHSIRSIKRGKTDTYYITCERFDMRRFLEFLKLTPDKLPLMAVMLGSDNSEYPNYKCLWPVIPNYQERMVKVASWISSRSTEEAVEEFSNHAKNRVSHMKLKQKLESFRCLKSKYLDNFEIYSNEALPENVREIENDRLVSEIPNIFLENFRKCRYSPYLMDIYIQNRYYGLKPQVENLNMPHSHIWSEKIVGAIHKILTNSSENVSCFVREGDFIGRKEIPLCKQDVPSFTESQEMDVDARKSVFLKILGLDVMRDTLEELPESWQLFVTAILYLQKLSPSFTLPLCYSVVLCKIILSYVDSKNRHLIRLYDEKFKYNYMSKRKNHISFPLREESERTVQISKEIKNFMKYFQISEDVRISFEINLLHGMSQFQSCLMHIKLLNDLLNMPFANFLIADCFNGTFIYNFSKILEQVRNIDRFIKISLKKESPTITDEFQTFVKKIDFKK